MNSTHGPTKKKRSCTEMRKHAIQTHTQSHLLVRRPSLSLLIYSSLHFVVQTLRLSHYLICFLSLRKDSSSNCLGFLIQTPPGMIQHNKTPKPSHYADIQLIQTPFNPPIIATH